MMSSLETLFAKHRFDRDDLDNILFYLENDAGGFNDIFCLPGRPIIYTQDGFNKLLGERPLQKFEVSAFLTKITNDEQAASEMIASKTELSPSYNIGKRGQKQYRYRVSCVPHRDVNSDTSAQLVLRSIQPDPMPLSKQRVEPELQRALESVEKGSIVIAGPTGSGKSTLTSGVIMHRVSDPDRNERGLTYEAPIEYVFDKVCKGANFVVQHEISPLTGHLKTFSEGIRSALRQAPTFIFVGESRDQETFDNFMKASNTGHLAITTMHVNTVADIPNRVISEFPNNSRKARLMEFCQSSRVWVIQLLFPKVGGGRVPLREFLILTDELQERISACEPENVADTVKKLVAEYGQSMESSARKALDAGEITELQYKLVSNGAY